MQKIVKQLLGEFFGTIIFLSSMTTSGIMADQLSQGNKGVALIAQSTSCAITLYVLINVFGPISSAHFNPLVTILFWEDLSYKILHMIAYIVTQIAAACIGVLFAHVMNDLPVFQASSHRRSGFSLCLSEVAATWILLATIYYFRKNDEKKVPQMVGFVVFTGIWSFPATFFCNPAVTIARCLTDTFIGIDPRDVGPFIGAQVIALGIAMVMFRKPRKVKVSRNSSGSALLASASEKEDSKLTE